MFRLHRLSRLAGVTILALLVAAVLMPRQGNAAPVGEVTVAVDILSQTFDPLATKGVLDMQYSHMLYDGLQNQGLEGKEKALAADWEIAKDGKTVDFMLRRGVRFHNGDALTAEDVKFTFESMLSEDSRHTYASNFRRQLERVEVINANRVRFHLKAPWPGLFTTVREGIQGIVPKAYYERVGPEGFQKRPVGTGPFKLVDFRPGEWSRFEANTDYWGQVSGIRTVTLRLVKEPFTRFAMLSRGEADIATGITGPLLEQIRKQNTLRVVFARYGGTSALQFRRTTNPEYSDRRVRMAIAHAIDREGISNAILSGVCEPSTQMPTPVTFGHVEGLEPIPYDPAKAKALLRAAGISNGHKTDIMIHTESYAGQPMAPQMLEAIAGNLEAVGFQVNRIQMDTAAFVAANRGRKQTGIWYQPSSIPDDGGSLMSTWFNSASPWNGLGIPQYDEMYKRQLTESDLDERKRIIQEFFRLEHEKRENVPLFWCHTAIAVGPRIGALKPSAQSGYHLNLHLARLK
jgi:peptide/nickel transport system substrate-binding protein